METMPAETIQQAQYGAAPMGAEIPLSDELLLLIDMQQRGAPELGGVPDAVPFGVDLMLRATVATTPDVRRYTATNRTQYTVGTSTRTSRQTANRATGATDAAPDTQPDQDIKYDRADALADIEMLEPQL